MSTTANNSSHNTEQPSGVQPTESAEQQPVTEQSVTAPTAETIRLKANHRKEGLAMVARLDERRAEMMGMLPSALKPLFEFKTAHPQETKYLYGLGREEATEAAQRFCSGSKRQFMGISEADPIAALRTPQAQFGLLHVLTADQASMLATDILSEAGTMTDPKEQKRMSRAVKLVRDWLDYA